jgi:quercetin dioxygenase-like cupin family protein
LELKPISPTAKAPGQNFTGDVYVNQVKIPDEPSRLIVGYVRFTPGARTNWHSHALGQTLHCTDGIGLVVTRDGAPHGSNPSPTGNTRPLTSTRPRVIDPLLPSAGAGNPGY